MHAFAFGAKWDAFGASGLASSAASRPSSRKSDAKASVPMPLAEVARKLRRDCLIVSWNGCMATSSLSRHIFVQVHERPRQRHPGGGLGRIRRAWLHLADELAASAGFDRHICRRSLNNLVSR